MGAGHQGRAAPGHSSLLCCRWSEGHEGQFLMCAALLHCVAGMPVLPMFSSNLNGVFCAILATCNELLRSTAASAHSNSLLLSFFNYDIKRCHMRHGAASPTQSLVPWCFIFPMHLAARGTTPAAATLQKPHRSVMLA